MKTAVSIPDDLFARVDRLARGSGRSRSEVYSTALREYLGRHQPDEVTAAIDKVIGDAGRTNDDAFIHAAARRSIATTDW